MNQDVRERASKCLQMYADEYEEIPCITAGNIAAISGLKVTCTGETLVHTQDKRHIQLFPMTIPPPVFVRSIEAASLSEEKKLMAALQSLRREDPSLRIQEDSETGQILVSGMGELHLDILSERLLEHYKVKCKLGPMNISYRETIRDVDLTREIVFDKEVLGKKFKIGLCYHISNISEDPENGIITPEAALNQMNVSLDLESIFIGQSSLKTLGLDKLPNGYPKLEEVQQSIRAGITTSLERGPLCKYPLINLKIRVDKLVLYDEGGSSIGAIRMAAHQSLQTLFKDLNAEQLEPIMKVVIMAPRTYVGMISRDLTGLRAGHVISLGNDDNYDQLSPGRKSLIAHIPLSNLLGYSGTLRSITAGNATFTMDILGYGKSTKSINYS